MFVFCQTAGFGAVDIAFGLPVTGKTEVWGPIHIGRHAEEINNMRVVKRSVFEAELDFRG